MAEPIIPDVAGIITGWRAWHVTTDGLLESLSQDHVWTPREATVATCGKRHPVPHEKCMCGLYAARTLDHLAGMGYNGYGADHFAIVGEVAMWGKVIVGTQGWRAQYAYPKRLLVPFEAWRHGKDLTNTYGVPAMLVNTLALGEVS
jgi:hypothetical protein